MPEPGVSQAAAPAPGLPPHGTHYLDHLRTQRRLAERTLALYASALEALQELSARAGKAAPDALGHDIRRWAAILHGRGWVPASIARTLSAWRGYYRWLGQQGLVAANPVDGVRAPRHAKPLPKALSVDQAVQLVQAGASPQANPALDARDRCVAELLYGCGLRISELTGLDTQAHADARGWIDLQAAEVHVLGKGGKRRMVPVGRGALQALQAWLALRPTLAKPNEPALFVSQRGGRLTDQQVRLRLRAQALQAGLPTHVHPHMLRHSFASHVLQSSQDLRAVQELLGHAHIGTTQVYTRLDFQHLAGVYDAAHPRARKPR